MRARWAIGVLAAASVGVAIACSSAAGLDGSGIDLPDRLRTDAGGDDANAPPPKPACDDGIKNGAETDIDCGGICKACALGSACAAPADCRSNDCTQNL